MAIVNLSLTKGIAAGTVPGHAKHQHATITDSTGGTATTTFIPIPAVGSTGATTAQEGAINDNFASIAACIVSITDALQEAGIEVSS